MNDIGMNAKGMPLPKQSSVDLSTMATKKQAKQDYLKNLAGLKRFAASESINMKNEKNDWVI